MTNNKLSIKLLWFLTPLVIVPIAALGLYILINITQNNEQKAESVEQSLAERKVSELRSQAQLYDSLIELLSSSTSMTNYLLAYQKKEQAKVDMLTLKLLDEFSTYVDNFPHILSIAFVDINHQPLAQYDSQIIPELVDYDFLNALANSDKVINHTFVSDPQDGTTLYISSKQFDKHFSLETPAALGYIVIKVDPVVFNTVVQMPPQHQSTKFNLIFNHQGRVLFSSLPQRINEIPEKQLAKLKELAHTGKLTQIDLLNNHENPFMVITTAINNDLYYLSAIDKYTLYSAGRDVTKYTALIIVFSVIMLPWMIFVVIQRLLLNPIQELGTASHKVGQGDLSIQLPQNRRDEIGSLYNEFNQMVNELNTNRQKLIDYREHLEEKVATRTQAIARINKQLEQAIIDSEQANHLKSRFLANMSHEIRTPLTAIIGFTETVLSQEPDKDKASYLSTVLRNSKHLLEIINNILDLSKIEAEKLEVEHKRVDLGVLFQDVISVVSAQADAKKLYFNCDFLFPLPKYIYSDFTRLKQILLNVCINAVKFTEQGEVELKVRYDEVTGQLVVYVTDSGIGMSKQEQDRVFKPFEQADISTTRKFGGTGLGLCISKSLANLLGGDINVTSKLSEGSTFAITLAANIDQRQPQFVYDQAHFLQAQESFKHDDVSAVSGHILVAEDNPDNRELISLLLTQLGAKAEFAHNGAEAVEKALNHDFDLILMDIQMPVMGGLEATQMLRKAAYTGPIIALTANVMKHDVDTYIANGFDKALAKPIDKDELANALKYYMKLAEQNSQSWQQLLEGDRFKEISNNYRAKLPQLLCTVSDLYKKQDLNELLSLAHSIKGSAGCFGFQQISDAAAELEQCIREHNEASLDYYVLKLEQAIAFILKTSLEGIITRN